jgi:hypothetical protein
MKHPIMTVRVLKSNSKNGFALLAGINRNVIPSQVTKMCKSIDKMGLVRPILVAELDFITGRPEKYIIDGQHLYNACIRNGYDIPYAEITSITNMVELAEHLAMLNNTSKSWTMQDYINVWCNINNDYKILNKYHSIYDIELTQLAEIMMYNHCTVTIGNKPVIKNIKQGSFRINDEKYSKTLLDFVTDVLKVVPRMDRVSNRLFISSYLNFINSSVNYKHDVFIKKLKANKDKFLVITQDADEVLNLIKSIA